MTKNNTKWFYILILEPENDTIQKRILYKTEFTRPYCIFKILSSINKNLEEIFFVLTDNVDYLYEFFYVENVDEFFVKCYLFYNKGNFAFGNDFYNMCFIKLSSKNFDKYYSFDVDYEQVNYNIIKCEVDYNNYFYISTKPYYILSRSKSNKNYIEVIIDNKLLLHDVYKVDIKQFKQFNNFRDLVLHCIELDKKEFMSKYKGLTNNEKLIYNEYYDILVDVAKGIEL